MSPRPYQLGKRQAAVDQTKSRIISAAYGLLTNPEGTPAFTMEAIAKAAGVARMTVYYQFGSRRELLEDLFDYKAEKGGMAEMAKVFGPAEVPACKPVQDAMQDVPEQLRPRDALEMLGRFIRVLAGFYDSDRMVMRRLRGIAAIDSEFGAVMEERNNRRRFGLRMVLQRLTEQTDWKPRVPIDALEDILFTLTSFETFDQLAVKDRDRETVCGLIEGLVRQTLGLAAAK